MDDDCFPTISVSLHQQESCKHCHIRQLHAVTSGICKCSVGVHIFCIIAIHVSIVGVYKTPVWGSTSVFV